MKYVELGKTGVKASVLGMGGDMSIFQMENPEVLMKISKRVLQQVKFLRGLEQKIEKKY